MTESIVSVPASTDAQSGADVPQANPDAAGPSMPYDFRFRWQPDPEGIDPPEVSGEGGNGTPVMIWNRLRQEADSFARIYGLPPSASPVSGEALAVLRQIVDQADALRYWPYPGDLLADARAVLAAAPVPAETPPVIDVDQLTDLIHDSGCDCGDRPGHERDTDHRFVGPHLEEWITQAMRPVPAQTRTEWALAELERRMTALAEDRQSTYMRGYDRYGDQAAGIRQARALLWAVQREYGFEITFAAAPTTTETEKD